MVSVAASVATAAVAAFAATVFVAAATATLSGLQLFGGGVAHEGHFALEPHVFAGQGVVEVHFDFAVAYFLDYAVDAIAVLGHHRHDSTGFDNLVVKFAVYDEDVLVEYGNLLGVVLTECFFGFSYNIEVAAFFKTFEGLFEGDDDAAGNTEYYLFGIIFICLVYKSFGSIGIYLVKVVSKFDIFAGNHLFCYFFHNCQSEIY